MTVVWLGNAAMTIWLRETASPETLRALLSLGLLLYAGWHLAKTAFFRPESPFDWTAAERELMFAMPLLPRDLIAYQLVAVTMTTFLKAGLFTLLLLPDLRCVPMGLLGLLLVMLTLEMFRMAIEIATWGMGQRGFLAYRLAVVVGLVAGGVIFAAAMMREDAFGGGVNVGEGLLIHYLDILVQMNDSVFGYAALPFQPFIDLVLAESMTAPRIALAAITFGTVTALVIAVIRLYTVTSRQVASRERRTYETIAMARGSCTDTSQCERERALRAKSSLRLARIPRWGGAGALAWRQLIGAKRHRSSLLVALIAPAVFACIPGFVIEDPYIAFLGTTATLAFYTFLLLPTALRFDFRRDLDRLATLRGLPLMPKAAVVGQTLAPALIATLFQFVVLAFAVTARSLPPYHVFIAMLVMIPLNVLVFGLDNLIYLLYPYRVQQEGVEIFLRTMLTFTAKGLLFAAGLAAMSTWGFVAADLTRGSVERFGSAFIGYTVFTGGVVVGLTLFAALVLYLLCRTYRNINPIEDIPR